MEGTRGIYSRADETRKYSFKMLAQVLHGCMERMLEVLWGPKVQYLSERGMG
jgi:hypothetical protein